MRKRPWEILLLTVVYAFAPLANLSFTCLYRGYDISALPYFVLALDPLDATGLAVYPFLAWAVFSVSRTGWWVFVVLNAALFGLNIWQASQVPGDNLLLVVGANALTVAVASLLFTKHARSPYFSPRLKWWTTETRYLIGEVLEVPVSVRQGTIVGRGVLVDVSMTGCFADLATDFSMDGPVEVEFQCWGLSIQSQGRIMRRSKPSESPQGYGIQFLKMTADQRYHLKSLVRTLKTQQVPSRDENPSPPVTANQGA